MSSPSSQARQPSHEAALDAVRLDHNVGALAGDGGSGGGGHGNRLGCAEEAFGPGLLALPFVKSMSNIPLSSAVKPQAAKTFALNPRDVETRCAAIRQPNSTASFQVPFQKLAGRSKFRKQECDHGQALPFAACMPCLECGPCEWACEAPGPGRPRLIPRVRLAPGSAAPLAHCLPGIRIVAYGLLLTALQAGRSRSLKVLSESCSALTRAAVNSMCSMKQHRCGVAAS